MGINIERIYAALTIFFFLACSASSWDELERNISRTSNVSPLSSSKSLSLSSATASTSS